jgi:membrane fusion protein, multidrug efflux system
MTINEENKADEHDDDLVEARAARKVEPKKEDSIDEPTKKPKVPFYRRPVLMAIIGVVAVVAIVGGVLFYMHASAHETTDDAFIEAHVVQISPKIAGYADQVLVEDNQHVNKGDLLVQIDPRDYEARLAEAQANLDAARYRLNEAGSNVNVLSSMVEAAKAAVVASQAEAEYARTQAERYEQVPNGAASQTEKASAEAARRTADANVVANQSKVAAAEAQLANGKAQEKTAAAQVAVAQTQVEQAQLNLSYTKITAPDSGRVTRRSVEAGAYLQTGQALLAIVPDDVWVVANFKETQLDHMRPGQPVKIEIDAYPDKTYTGHVDSIQSGTGARFSLLPPENATGNYVKVVQRVPVKIVFDQRLPEDLSIAPGMSVEPDVKVK